MTLHPGASRAAQLAALSVLAVLGTPALAQPSVVIGGLGTEETRAVARDAAGNVFVAGVFEQTVDFDPTDGPDAADTFTSPAGVAAFVASYRANGTFRWAAPLSSGLSRNVNATDLATDGVRVYVAGSFAGTVDFDAGPGTASRTSAGDFDAFLVAYDAATGAPAWVAAVGNTLRGSATGVDVLDGRVFVSGALQGQVDFDPGVGVANRSAASTQRSNAWIGAYRAADGAFLWAGVFLGSGGSQDVTIAPDVAADGARVATAGFFTGTVDFDPGGGTQVSPAGTSDLFVVGLDAATGAFGWGVPLAGPSNESLDDVAARGGVVFVGGGSGGGVDFDPGPGTAVPANAQSYVAAYDLATGAFRWAGGYNFSVGLRLAADGGRVVVAGSILTGTLDLDPGPGVQNRTSNGGNDAWLAAYGATDGAFGWANAVGGTGGDVGQAVDAAAGRVSLGVRFNGTTDLDPGPAAQPRTSAGSEDVFVASYDAATGAFVVAVAAEDDPRAVRLFAVTPNPSERGQGRVRLVLDEGGPVSLALYDVLGRRIAVLFEGQAAAGAPVEAAFPVGLPPGVYVVRAATAAGVASRRFTVVR